MSRILGLLAEAYRAPEGEIIRGDQDRSQYYKNWGFTIYRTDYSASSEQRWQVLIDRIRSQVVETVVANTENSDKDFAAAHQFLSLFRLDVQSDAATLKDADMDQVRNIFLQGPGAIRMNTAWNHHGLCLLVDSEVLAAMAEGDSWIKCVQSDYVAADYVPRNTWCGGQRYFGWMKMATESVLVLWDELKGREIEQIAPPTIGGMHLVVYESVAL